MIELIHEPIDESRVLAAVRDPACGAEVLFVGTTRQWTELQIAGEKQTVQTEHLIYESYREMAFAQLQELERIARHRWPLKHVAIVHRLGKVLPTEASVAIAVSCPHRREAFEAGQWLIDEIKHRVPIWKQEHYVQSGSEWIHPTSGSCHCDQPRPAAASSAASRGADLSSAPFQS